jgi:hypothetical protein
MIMKNLKYIVFGIIILFASGCYDRDIIDSKPGEPIDPVTNLSYLVEEGNIILSWNLPADNPSDIILPVSVYIKVYRDEVLISTVTIAETTTYTYSAYNSEKSYRFVVKVVGDVDTDDPNAAVTRYSLGAYVVID